MKKGDQTQDTHIEVLQYDSNNNQKQFVFNLNQVSISHGAQSLLNPILSDHYGKSKKIRPLYRQGVRIYITQIKVDSFIFHYSRSSLPELSSQV